MWAIYNKKGERMYQYPASEYEDDALRILRKAQQNNPEVGFHIKWTEEGSEE